MSGACLVHASQRFQWDVGGIVAASWNDVESFSYALDDGRLLEKDVVGKRDGS